MPTHEPGRTFSPRLTRNARRVAVIAPRVRNRYETRPGHSKLDCPSCHEPCWVSRDDQRDLDNGAGLTCRECFRQ